MEDYSDGLWIEMGGDQRSNQIGGISGEVRVEEGRWTGFAKIAGVRDIAGEVMIIREDVAICNVGKVEGNCLEIAGKLETEFTRHSVQPPFSVPSLCPSRSAVTHFISAPVYCDYNFF